jgi:hypothetical protein
MSTPLFLFSKPMPGVPSVVATIFALTIEIEWLVSSYLMILLKRFVSVDVNKFYI